MDSLNGGEIWIAQNKPGKSYVKARCTDSNQLGGENSGAAIAFFGGDPPCSRPGFIGIQADGAYDVCAEVPSCDVVGGENCYGSLGDCENAVFSPVFYYCVRSKSGSGACCGSAIEGGWLCLSEFSGSLSDCSAQDYSFGRTEFFSDSSCDRCDFVPAEYVPSFGVGEQAGPTGSVYKVPVSLYDPAVHEIVSGPSEWSVSCEGFSSSSGSSGGDSGGGSSGSSGANCHFVECGCDPATDLCAYADCGLGPDGWMYDIDCDLCKCVQVAGFSSSSSDPCHGLPVSTASCASLPGVTWCSYLSQTHENGCPKSYTCGILSGGQCLEYSPPAGSNFAASVSGVLGSNSDFPEYYYGEDGVSGWITTSAAEVQFIYPSLDSSGLPFSADVFVGGVAVATVVFPPSYVGSSLAVVYGGVVYYGTVSESGIYMT